MGFPRLLFTVSFSIIIKDILQIAAAAESDTVTDGEQFVKRIVHGEKMSEIPGYLQFTAPYKLCEGGCDEEDNNFAFAFPIYIGKKGNEKYKEMYSRDYNHIHPNGPYKKPPTKKIFTLCPTSVKNEFLTTDTNPTTEMKSITSMAKIKTQIPTIKTRINHSTTEYEFDTPVTNTVTVTGSKYIDTEITTTEIDIETPTAEATEETTVTESRANYKTLNIKSETLTSESEIEALITETEIEISNTEKEIPVTDIETKAPNTETESEIITTEPVLPTMEKLNLIKKYTKTTTAKTDTETSNKQKKMPSTGVDNNIEIIESQEQSPTKVTQIDISSTEIKTESFSAEIENKIQTGHINSISPADKNDIIQSDKTVVKDTLGRRCPLKICHKQKSLDQSESIEIIHSRKTQWNSDYTDVLDSLYSA